eukprot:4189640-Pyramimonas_sp.AAC.1
MATAGVDTATAGVDTATAGVDTGTAGVDTGTAGVDTATAGVDMAMQLCSAAKMMRGGRVDYYTERLYPPKRVASVR